MITVALSDGSRHELGGLVTVDWLVKEMPKGGLMPTRVMGVYVRLEHIVSVVAQ